MFKNGKLLFIALLFTGLIALTYGGCGGGSDDTNNGPTPTAPPSTDDDVIMPPPTDPPPTDDPSACEGNAFDGTATASARGVVGDCLTDFITQNAEDSSLICFCNASEAGNFIFNVAPVFAGFMKVNLEFPENTDPDTIVPTSFSFDWTAPGCSTMELFTTQTFISENLISIGTLDNMTETGPDLLTFTANLSDPFLSSALGNPGQNVVCDFCSIGGLPQCAPQL